MHDQSDAGGNTTSIGYNGFGYGITAKYDAWGRLVRSDIAGRSDAQYETHSYDALGRLISTLEDATVSITGHMTVSRELYYDASGQVIEARRVPGGAALVQNVWGPGGVMAMRDSDSDENIGVRSTNHIFAPVAWLAIIRPSWRCRMDGEPKTAKAQVWRERVAAQLGSGQSIREWCRRNGCHEHSFHWWRSRLGLSPAATRSGRGGGAKPVGFARVVVDPPLTNTPEPIRLWLLGGRELTLPASMPIEHLARIIHAIEGGA